MLLYKSYQMNAILSVDKCKVVLLDRQFDEKTCYFDGNPVTCRTVLKAQTLNLVCSAATDDLLSLGHLIERVVIYHGY